MSSGKISKFYHYQPPVFNVHYPTFTFLFICNGYGESILKANWMSEIIFHNLVGKMMAVVERAKFRVGLKFKILFGYNT